ncbi:hypothetical protein BH10ACT11_BH10ACT11_05870 [soil metagenome]
MKTLACSFAACLVLGLGACGGGDDSSSQSSGTATTPDEMAIASTLRKYETATKNHDAELFCTQVLANKKNPQNGSDPKLCPITIKAVMSDPTSLLSKAVKIDVQEYVVNGRYANVKALVNGKPQTLRLSNGQNGWRFRSLG